MLRIGRIDYANCTPIFHALQDHAAPGDYQFISGVPSHLNSMLASGELDACPSSSFEYAVHPERYRIIPQVSISSCGAVASVLLFSRIPVEELDGHIVLLSSESATSVNLLKILLARRYGLCCTFEQTRLSIDDALMSAPAILLIGDTALRASLQRLDVHIYDLGEIWHSWTGLPFVFALWLCTRSAVQERRDELIRLSERLQVAKLESRRYIEALAEYASEAEWLGKQRLIDYWRDNISYELGPSHLEGLKHFFRGCAELGLLATAPELHFLQDEQSAASF